MSPNSIKMQIMDVVDLRIKFLQFTAKLVIYSSRKLNHIKLCVSFVDSAIYHVFGDTNIVNPFFGLEPQIMLLSENFLK